MRETRFFRQADLLIQVMPFVNAEACFALKGGTAINFFVRDFPRLSVDIELVYLPLEDRSMKMNIGGRRRTRRRGGSPTIGPTNAKIVLKSLRRSRCRWRS
jgi:hypothetical protein